MSRKNIRIKSMLGTSHSWSVTLRSLIHEFLDLNQNCFLESINGYEMMPLGWHKYKLDLAQPDIDLTYTLPRNFKNRFNKDSHLKLAIYNYETSILPAVWKDCYKHLDYVLPSSHFSKKVFVDAGWPEDRCIVVPHGIRLSDFDDKRKVNNLKTKKRFKFLNVSIPHYRKNIYTLLEAYYSEFSANDDVCLIIKSSNSKPKYHFECNVVKEILKAQKKAFKKKKNLPQVELITTKYESIIPLYNSCQCLVSATSSEGFGLPLLEAIAAKMIVVAPHVTGQADFLNTDNSIKVDAKEVLAPKAYQYWRPSRNAKTYMPDVDSLREGMRRAYNMRSGIPEVMSQSMLKTAEKFTWRNAAKQILEIQ